MKNILRVFRFVAALTVIGSPVSFACTPPPAESLTRKMFPESPLARWAHDGQFDDVVFEVAATFPMKKMATGVVYDGSPFDVEEFVRQIGVRT